MLVSVQMPAQFLERALTQEIGIALARLGTLDDSFGDDSVGEIVCKSGDTRVISSATPRTRLVSGLASKSPR